MQNFNIASIGLLIFFAGLTAGQMYHEMVGAQEALSRVDDSTYVTYWKSLDGIMAVRMPVAANLLFLLFIIVLIVFRAQYKSPAYLLIIVSLLCFIAETIVTVKFQLPINHKLQAIDVNRLPSDFNQLKTATLNHFIIRAVLRFAGFMILVFSALALLNQIPKPVAIL